MEDCKYGDKIISMHTDIKWIKESLEKREEEIDTHISESDKFRRAVDRNTTWRHAFKAIIGIVIGVLGWIARGVGK